MTIKIFVAALLLANSMSVLASDYVIHAGRLIDGKSNKAAEKMSVFVKGNRITDIKSGYIAPAAEQKVVDLKNHTLMPGLMDMHSHVDMIVDAEYYTNKFFKDEADQALRATRFTEDLLMAGFTTVRNLGGAVSLNIRDAVNAGTIPGPRIYAAGIGISTTGGHLDHTSGLNKQLSHLFGPPRSGPRNS